MNLLWSEHEKLAGLIGAAVVTGNQDWEARQLGLWAIEAIDRAGYAIVQKVVVLTPA
jgi:hypothetical protein